MNGYKYGLTCLDDYSSHGVLFFLKRKNNALASLKAYKAWAKLKVDQKMKTIRSDGGIKFINSDVKTFLAESGIEM